jgi:hypothetical protein
LWKFACMSYIKAFDILDWLFQNCFIFRWQFYRIERKCLKHMILKGWDKEDVESVHIKIADIKTENYSVTKVENTNLWKTVTCDNILNQSYTKHWTLLSIKIRQYTSLMKYITLQQLTKGMHAVDLCNGNLYSPVKIEDIQTRQTRSDDSLGISLRSSEPTAELLLKLLRMELSEIAISLMMTYIKLELRKENNIFLIIFLLLLRGLRGHDRMVVGCTSICTFCTCQCS